MLRAGWQAQPCRILARTNRKRPRSPHHFRLVPAPPLTIKWQPFRSGTSFASWTQSEVHQLFEERFSRSIFLTVTSEDGGPPEAFSLVWFSDEFIVGKYHLVFSFSMLLNIFRYVGEDRPDAANRSHTTVFPAILARPLIPPIV